ncbi:MAG: tryptophan synthase subunit alpha [Candidatus Eremiobacteraeota bacterium]|nr:tryptophan synthase subunit alpha [Candidatus Eremiobacteraeota bacterium]
MLERVFERAHSVRRCAFIPYIVAGDPDLETTELFLCALTQSGADIIELGVPYGDPLADGAAIAAAAHRALKAGITLEAILGVAQRAATNACAPIVLFSYFNPILQYGIERFATDVATAQVRGVIVPDIAFEESQDVRYALAASGVQMPLLISPTTPAARAQMIADSSSAFVYVVSRLGVTGVDCPPNIKAIQTQLAPLRKMTRKPLAVGFGISTPPQVESVAALVDGVIVGSALIEAYGEARGLEAVDRIQNLSTRLISACKLKELSET